MLQKNVHSVNFVMYLCVKVLQNIHSDKFVMYLCVNMLQKNVHSNKFVSYLCINVLPTLSAVSGDTQLEIVKVLAEMVGHSVELSTDSLQLCLTSTYNTLTVSITH